LPVRPGFLAVLATLAAMPLSGCIPIAIGGAASAGYVASQERGISGQVSDTAINAQIVQKWREFNPDMARQLTIDVYQGRVLIVGPVSNPEYADEAVKRAWQVEGVKEVNADVAVASHQTFSGEVRDSLISKELRTKIIFDSEVKSLNYNIDAVNGTVYLMGSARSQSELDRVTEYARNISGVRRVVSYVKIRAGTAEADSGNGPSGNAPSGNGAASTSRPRPLPPADSGPAVIPAAPPPPYVAPGGGNSPGGSSGAIEAHPL